MIRNLIRWLFSEEIKIEKDAILSEAKDILEGAKGCAKKEYIKFDHVPINTEAFLYGMSKFCNDNNVLSWLLGYKDMHVKGITESIIAGNDRKVLTGSAQLGMVEVLISDLDNFNQKYLMMIEQKKRERNETP